MWDALLSEGAPSALPLVRLVQIALNSSGNHVRRGLILFAGAVKCC